MCKRAMGKYADEQMGQIGKSGDGIAKRVVKFKHLISGIRY